MGRILRSRSSGVEEIPQHKEATYKIQLSNNLKAEFREILLEDILAIRSSKITDELEASIRIISRVCTSFGDKPGVAPVHLEKLSARDFASISELLGTEGTLDIENIAAERKEELADYSIQLTLFDGTIVVFRDITVGDMKQIRKQSSDQVEQTAIAAALTCTRWGDKDGISYQELGKINYQEFLLINEALKSFLRRN
jgi:predicted house-cleaning noncanonical NTP pyrophosphatase (MazG superfamily)